MGTDHSPSILLHSSRLCPKPVEGTPPVERHARAEPGTAEEGVKGQTAVAMKSELTSVCASGGLLKARRPDWIQRERRSILAGGHMPNKRLQCCGALGAELLQSSCPYLCSRWQPWHRQE